MNTELLLKVKEQILKEPAHFDMQYWLHRGLVPCRTTACIAGWAFSINRGLSPRDAERLNVSVRANATRALRLSNEEQLRLFLVSNWPAKYSIDYLNASDPISRAKIAAERIDWFIHTNGADQPAAPPAP